MNGAFRGGKSNSLGKISPVVWALGITSFLTDISAEMLNSVLPVYLFFHLRLSPSQFGIIDGVYNGLSVALVALVVGLAADRWGRHKEAAATGYGLSAICKILLIVAGSAWGWIVAVIGLDRLGKGIRTAPRDAMLSLSTAKQNLAIAFGVHRALDSAGALLGPIVAFLLLAQLGTNNFNSLWLASFMIAITGVAALWIFVPGGRRQPRGNLVTIEPLHEGALTTVLSMRFAGLIFCGTILAMVTISDGFLYLLIQRKGTIDAGYLPLFYVATAASFMFFAIPAGYLADARGRARVFSAGYVVLASIYSVLLFSDGLAPAIQVACLVALGLFYAATEGVLMALASTIVPATHRATGLALLMTGIGFGKFCSSLLFGKLWQSTSADAALTVYLSGSAVVILATFIWFRRWQYA